MALQSWELGELNRVEQEEEGPHFGTHSSLWLSPQVSWGSLVADC